MKRNAFTLVELLVVVSIIALLATILSPSLVGACAIARKAVCAANLHHIGEGFATHNTQMQQTGLPTTLFPATSQWPGVPMGSLDSGDVFICPEAEGEGVGGDVDYLSAMTYVNRPRGLEIPMSSVGGLGEMWVGYRRGSDGRGAYMEIGTDDNSTVTAGYLNSDGHDGVIRVYDEQPGGMVTAVLWRYSCGEKNCVLYNGEPLFPDGSNTDPSSDTFGWLGPGTSKNGMEVELASGGCTSYGMNVNASKFQGGKRRVAVLDFDSRIVRPDRSDIQKGLEDAARHLGTINILYSDDSVGSAGPTEIDPRIPTRESLWLP